MYPKVYENISKKSSIKYCENRMRKDHVSLAYNDTAFQIDDFLKRIKNLNVINELAKLKDGWDGKGSYAFDEKVLTASFDLVNKLEVQPKISPTLRQSIQIEYEKDDYYLEFEIFKDRIEYYFDYASEEDEGFVSKVIGIDFEKINEMVNDFVSKTI